MILDFGDNAASTLSLLSPVEKEENDSHVSWCVNLVTLDFNEK